MRSSYSIATPLVDLQLKAGDYNISHAKALELCCKGMQSVGNLWNQDTKQFKRLEVFKGEFGFNKKTQGESPTC
jgi:hypothetical protein